MELKIAYQEIFDILNKNKDNISSNIFNMFTAKCKDRIFGFELIENYGLDVDLKLIHSLDNTTFYKLKREIYITKWRKGMQISISEDGTQPEEGECLMIFQYPTGAYIFGEDYPKEIFEEFFLKLKSYGPKYCDVVNKSLYFTLNNVADVFNSYDEIFKTYYNKCKSNMEQKKLKALRKQLLELETKLNQNETKYSYEKNK